MVIVQYGLAKSGSSFIFQVLTDILQNRYFCWNDYMKNRNGFVPEKYHGDYVEIKNNELEELISFVPPHEFFMFKTHDAPGQVLIGTEQDPGLSDLFQSTMISGHLKVIATARDPRDMCLSYFNHAEAHRKGEKDFFANDISSPFDAVPNVINEYRILKYWMKYKSVHWISYHQICEQPLEVMEAMKRYIGLFNIDSSKFVNKLLGDKKRIHQFNKGYVDRWKKELSEADGEKLTQVLRPQIRVYESIRKKANASINRS